MKDLPNCPTNFVMVPLKLSPLFRHFINTTDYYLAHCKPSLPSAYGSSFDLTNSIQAALGQSTQNFADLTDQQNKTVCVVPKI